MQTTSQDMGQDKVYMRGLIGLASLIKIPAHQKEYFIGDGYIPP